MNTEDMRQHFESDGSPRRFDSGTAGADSLERNGSVISLEQAINDILLRRGATNVSATEIAEVVYRVMGDYTVNAKDYDKLAEAARWLRRSCRDRLPPGHYQKVVDECLELDAILSPNGRDEERAGLNQSKQSDT